MINLTKVILKSKILGQCKLIESDKKQTSCLWTANWGGRPELEGGIARGHMKTFGG